jgi:hypothetical protein
MPTWNGQRLAGAAGLLFVLATLVSLFIVSPPPGADQPAAKFLTYYSDHRTVLMVQAIIGVLANIPALLFAGGLWSLLKRDEGEGAVLGTAAVFALIAAGAIIALMTSWPAGLAYLADGNGLDETSARTLTILSSLFSVGIFPMIASVNVFSGWRFLQGTTIPKWIGWVGLIAAILAVVGIFTFAKSGAFAPFGFFSFAAILSFLAYVAIISFFMGRRAI